MQGDGDEVKAVAPSAVRIAGRRMMTPSPTRPNRCARTITWVRLHVELRVDVAYMHLDRLWLHAKMSCDARVGFALRQIIKHLALAPRQRDDLLRLTGLIKEMAHAASHIWLADCGETEVPLEAPAP